MVAKGVVKVGLACASRTMKEKGLPCLIGDSRTDLLKGCVLSRIEPANMLLSKFCLIKCIIVQLLSKEWIPNPGPPVPNNFWHAVPVPKVLARGSKKLIDEVKPIIMNLCLGWIVPKNVCMPCMPQIITNGFTMGVPQCPWISRSTVLKNGDKEVAQLKTSLHVASL
jgi:hypothetical protein